MTPKSFWTRLSRFLLQHPILMFVLLTLVTVCIFYFASQVKVEAGQRMMFKENDPVYATNQAIEKKFGTVESLVLIYKADDLFSKNTLETIRELGRKFEELNFSTLFNVTYYYVDKVESLATIRDLVGKGDRLSSDPLVPESIPGEAEALEQIRQRAYNNPLIRDGFISQDGKYGLMVISLPVGVSDQSMSDTVSLIRQILSIQEKKDKSIEYILTGTSVGTVDAVRNQLEDLSKFSLFSYLAMFVLFFIFVRKIWGVLIGVVIGTINMVSGIAMLEVLGGSIGPISTLVPPILMAISSSIYLHYISVQGKYIQEFPSEQAGVETFSSLLPPVLFGQFTTAIGFGSFITSDVPTVSYTGMAVGAGIMICCVVATLLLAIFFRSTKKSQLLVSPKGLGSSKQTDKWMESLANFSIRHYKGIGAFALGSFCIVGYGVFLLELNHDTLRDGFRKEDPIYQSFILFDEQFGGGHPMVLSIKKKTGNFLNPSELKKLEELSTFLTQHSHVGRVFSFVNFLKFINREYNDGMPEYYRIPDSPEQSEQLLLLMGGDDRLWQYVNTDYSWVRLEVRTSIYDSKSAVAFFRLVDEYLKDKFPEGQGYEAIGTGPSRLLGEFSHMLLTTLAYSFTSSFVVVCLLFFLVFRSIRIGLIGIVPNLYPLVVMMGILGWLGVNLNIFLVGAISITLGMVDDNTIHFLHYARHRFSVHGDLKQAIRETFCFDGMAMIWNSFLMCLGFSILITSNLSGMRWLGIIVCVAMALALIGAMGVLPAILLLLKKRAGFKFDSGVPKTDAP